MELTPRAPADEQRQNMDNHHGYFKMDFLTTQLERANDFKTVSETYAILSDPSRLRIFWLLCHCKQCGSDIASELAITTPAVSHHLKVLKDAGLIESYRDGKEVYYKASSGQRAQSLHRITEDLMQMSCPDFDSKHEKINQNSEYLEDQVKVIKKVHDYMKDNLSQRFTISELSKQFGMNSTTLKTVFKDVYGDSIAAHIKQHRMEKAADLLIHTDLSIAVIASEAGYETSGKFSRAFKDCYESTPLEYRKQNQVHKTAAGLEGAIESTASNKDNKEHQ